MKLGGHLTAMIIVGVCLTMALPILAAIALAQHQAVQRDETYLTGLARNALARSETTGRQLGEGARLMSALTHQQACSDKGLDLMRKIDLGSTMLRAVGHLDGDVMTCSSFGGKQAFDLGPAQMRSRFGADIRTNVKLLDPKVSYLAFGVGSFVGIVNKEAPLTFFEDVPGLSVGVFSWSHRIPLVVRGAVASSWIGGGPAGDRVFHSGNQLVAIVQSKRADVGAVAALPLAHTSALVREQALVLIPLGAVAGLLLSAILIYVVRARSSMRAMIRQGLKAGEFHLLYQPIIDLRMGKTIGAEALVRWSRGGREVVPPDIFIAVAERDRLISLITARVLDLLSADARQVLQLAPLFRFSVNYSAADLHRPDMLEQVQGFMARSGVTSDNLVIEATERSLVDVNLARDAMRKLRAAGIKVAIDDFGTGYSSLGYLAQLEVDCIKIDKLFVHALGTESATSQVAARIIDMSKDLNLHLVAEGVETPEQERLLKGMNVEFSQGFLHGRPMPLEDLLQRLRAEREAVSAPAKAAVGDLGRSAHPRRRARRVRPALHEVEPAL